MMTEVAALLMEILLAPPLMALVIQEWESAMREREGGRDSETEKRERSRDHREGWVWSLGLLTDLWYGLVC